MLASSRSPRHSTRTSSLSTHSPPPMSVGPLSPARVDMLPAIIEKLLIVSWQVGELQDAIYCDLKFG